MKIFIYVEGPSDKKALEELFKGYKEQLRDQRHGLAFLHLKNKSRFLAKIGPRAAEKLADNDDDRVVALPDLYPNRDYAQTPYAHPDLNRLRCLMSDLVAEALRAHFAFGPRAVRQALCRFCASALKHDLEMLLLAAWPRLKEYIAAPRDAAGWRHPVEEQDQAKPPKRVVERLFMSSRQRAYRDTIDAPEVLRRVEGISELLYTAYGQLECPVFKAFLDWLRDQTGVPAY